MDPRRFLDATFAKAAPWKLIAGSMVATALLCLSVQIARDPRAAMRALVRMAFRTLKQTAVGRRVVAAEQSKLMRQLEQGMHRYADEPTFYRLPSTGLGGAELVAMMQRIKEHEDAKWRGGKVSGTVYIGADEHTALLNQVITMFAMANPLHLDVFPSMRKFEGETVRMTAALLSGGDDVVGAMTSGGTESIIMALKTYRDRARDLLGITEPEVVLPVTAHPAFDKGAQYLCIKLVKAPLAMPDAWVDVAAVRRLITPNTILLVGSAPNFPHGIIDPIEQLAAAAREHRLPLHVDCCLGGFVLPFQRQLGHALPDFDFAVPGVTSVSVDPHKYGFAAKGSSIILFENRALRRYMYFTAADWPGGLYCSPTMPGSRPGSLVAACWASMVSLGQEGYRESASAICRSARIIKEGIRGIAGLAVIGEPLCMIVAFSSERYNVFQLSDWMSKRGWILNALQHPDAIHIACTMRTVGHEHQFVADLREAVERISSHPEEFCGGMAPIYGMAGSGFVDREQVAGMLSDVLDVMLKAP